MSSGTVGQKVLEKVVARLGSERAARMLGISRGVLERFMAGRNGVPDAVLLKAVDLLSEEPKASVYQTNARSEGVYNPQ